MKIYVDEIPKSCCGCLFQDYETSSCCMDDSINCAMQDDKKAKNCPLHPVAEREEVRKEVVGEIRKYLKDNKGVLIGMFNIQTFKHDEIEVLDVKPFLDFLDQVERREK